MRFNFGNRYLDPGANDETSSLGGNAHSVLAQYVFNSICRGKLSSSGRTRKALAVTLGDDVIGENQLIRQQCPLV